MSKDTKHLYRLTKPGAQHRGKRDGAWVTWQTGGEHDVIDLTEDQFNSGAYNHLGLVPVKAHEVNTRKDEDDTAGDEPKASKKSKKAKAADDEADESEETEVSKEQIEELIKAVEESHGADGLKEARQKVIDADLFEEGTLPTRKAALIEALNDLLDGD